MVGEALAQLDVEKESPAGTLDAQALMRDQGIMPPAPPVASPTSPTPAGAAAQACASGSCG